MMLLELFFESEMALEKFLALYGKQENFAKKIDRECQRFLLFTDKPLGVVYTTGIRAIGYVIAPNDWREAFGTEG